MFKLKDFYSFSLIISVLVFFNPVCYADINVMSDAYAGGGNQGHGQGQGHGNGQGHGHGKGHSAAITNNKKAHNQKNSINKNVKNAANARNKRFSNKDVLVIKKYYSANQFPVTTLPPGIAKNLLRGKPLPPGIAKVFLPSDLMSQLPAYPGYEYLVAGKDVLLVNSTTNVVSDILTNVLR